MPHYAVHLLGAWKNAKAAGTTPPDVLQQCSHQLLPQPLPLQFNGLKITYMAPKAVIAPEMHGQALMLPRLVQTMHKLAFTCLEVWVHHYVAHKSCEDAV